MKPKKTLAILAGLATFYLSSSFCPAEKYILVNKSKRETYIIKNNQVIKKFPVGVGRKSYETPSGEFIITNKIKNPSWSPNINSRWLSKKARDYIKNNGPIPSKSPLNPLGKYWIGLSRIENYEPKENIGIHDVDNDVGIGEASSHGCIRVKTKNLDSFFEEIPIGTRVRIDQGKF
jgi:lipoprotein-anchoring transpeptidase ErfK/SrfK